MKLLDNKECCVNVYRVFGQGARLFVKLVNQNQTPSHEGLHGGWYHMDIWVTSPS